ncbi:MAG: DUF2487 family protein [Paenibacillaceae bacterium]
MKFSEIQQNEWDELKPYLDTCLLPLTGLTGEESPSEVTEQLEKLRDLIDFVEIPFKGRVVTYPSVQYQEKDEQMIATIDTLCLMLKRSTFKFVILITVNDSLAKLDFHDCDLLISPQILTDDASENRAKIISEIQNLWK